MSQNRTEGRGRRSEYTGTVISDKMDKTITVEVDRYMKHQRYGKYITSFTTFKVHDEKNEASTGDKVLIYETRPLSKTKRWKLIKIIEKAPKELEVEI